MSGKTLASLNVRLGLQVREFNKNFRKVNRDMKRFKKNMSSIANGINSAITRPLAAAGAIGVKFSTDLQSEFSKIENLVGVTGQQLQDLKDGARDMSVVVGQSQADLAKAMFVVTSAGQRGKEALDITLAAAKASAVGMGDMVSIARASTAVINAYGKETITASQAANILFNTVKEGNLDAETLAGSIGKVVGLSSQMGVSFAEVGANMATYTRLGLSADEAATGLTATLSTFLNPTAQARDALAQLGISASDMRDSIAKNGLAATLVSLSEKLDGNYDALGAVIPNIRAMKNILGVTGSQAEEYVAITQRLTNDTDGLSNAFDKASKSPAQQFKQSMVALKNAAIDLGNIFLPIAIKIANGIKLVAQWWSNLSDTTQKVIVSTLGAVAGFGAAISVVLKLSSIIGAATKAFGLVKLAISSTGIVLKALGAIVAANPLGLLLTVLAGVATGLTIAYQRSEKFRAVLSGLGSFIREVFAVFREGFSAFGDAFAAVKEGRFIDAGKKFGEFLTKTNPVGIAFSQGGRLAGAFSDGYQEKLAAEQASISDSINDAVDNVSVPPVVPVVPSFDLGGGLGDDLSIGAIDDGAVEATKSKLQEINDVLTAMRAKNELIGTSYDLQVERVRLLKEGIGSLLDDGLSPVSDAVRDLQDELSQSVRPVYEVEVLARPVGVGIVKSKIDEANEAIDVMRAKNQLVGAGYDLHAERIKLIKEEINSLLDDGYAPTSTAVTSLVAQLQQVEETNKRIIASGQTSAESLSGVAQFVSNNFQLIGNTLQSVFSNVWDGIEKGGKLSLRSLLSPIGAVIKKLVIAAGAAFALSLILPGLGIGAIGGKATSFKSLLASFSGLSFFAGTTRTPSGNVDSRRGFLATLHPNERVVPEVINRAIGYDFSNEDLLAAVNAFKSGYSVQSVGSSVSSASVSRPVVSRSPSVGSSIDFSRGARVDRQPIALKATSFDIDVSKLRIMIDEDRDRANHV